MPITNDGVYEGEETYSVNLSNATGGASIGSGSVAPSTIVDDRPSDPTDLSGPPANDDRPQVTSVTSPSVSEGGDLDFVVTLSNPSTTPTTVTLTPADGSGRRWAWTPTRRSKSALTAAASWHAGRRARR
ncbi:MAG: hypothetical protein V9G22_06140 [Ottowia sp.]